MPVRGIIFALSAGILWGLVPLYIKFVDAADPYEIVVQRAFWSLVLLWYICMARRHLGAVRLMVTTPRIAGQFFVTMIFLTLNWGIYVYAVQTEQVVAAALGYFIYPLCTVLLGMILLDEKLDRWAWMAIGLVLVGVWTKAAMIQGVPWISLMLAGSFSVYAVLRKRMGFDPAQGLLVETIMLLPLVIAFFGWMLAKDIPLFFGGGATNFALAITAGVLTVIPLIMFHAGNRELSMTMASLIFYSNPTMQLLLGIVLFGELFSLRDLWTFGFIWAGIALYFITRQRVGRVTPPHV